MKRLDNPLLNSAIILAAVTTFLYCASTAYNGGLLGVLNLDANALKRDFHQVLYNGFLISIIPVVWTLSIYTALSYCYSHAVLPGSNDWLRKRYSRKRRYLKIKHRLTEKQRDSNYEKTVKQHTVTVSRFLLVIVVFIASMIYFEAKGRDEALRIQKKLEKPVVELDLVSTTINNTSYKLVKMACGAHNCAGIDPATKLVHYFPSNGYSFLYSPMHLERKSSPATKNAP